jgi:putative peptidoglycan lipid II flippase
MRDSANMAVGTVLSRVTGVMRDMAMTAALGFFIVSDAYSLGNTLPNILYILVIGGAVNAVFVPQLVRHMKSDEDDGKAFADRLLSLLGVALLALSVLSVIAAPLIVRIYATSGLSDTEFNLAVAFARLCLPQIFFYGVYTLLNQVLNARGQFKAGAYAPIYNNVVAIIVFVGFLVVVAPQADSLSSLTDAQVWWLGLGTTAGVALQALILLPAVVRSGYRFSFRTDWKGAGLSRAGGLAAWTLGLVVVNQIAYAVVTRLATSANVAALQAGEVAAGLTTYQKAHLIFILPHSVVTVSLVTALLPHLSRMAHDGELDLLGRRVGSAARTVLALIIPMSVLLAVTAPEISVLLFGNGVAGAEAARLAGQVVALFAIGLPAYSLIYVLFRAWYAMENTRTPFWFAVLINLINLSIAIPLFNNADVGDKIGTLAISYSAAYIVAAAVAWIRLGRIVPELGTAALLTSLFKLTVAAGVAGGLTHLLLGPSLFGSGFLGDFASVSATWLVGGLVFIALAHLLKVDEVGRALAMVRARLGK